MPFMILAGERGASHDSEPGAGTPTFSRVVDLSWPDYGLVFVEDARHHPARGVKLRGWRFGPNGGRHSDQQGGEECCHLLDIGRIVETSEEGLALKLN